MIGAEEAGSGADGAGDSRTTPTATARTTAAAEAATGTAPPDGGDVSVVQPGHPGTGFDAGAGFGLAPKMREKLSCRVALQRASRKTSTPASPSSVPAVLACRPFLLFWFCVLSSVPKIETRQFKSPCLEVVGRHAHINMASACR